MRTRPRRQPHTEIGQSGRGTGRRNRTRARRYQSPYAPTPPQMPQGLPETNPPNLGGMPAPPPAVPNFLPNTPGFEHAQTGINDANMAAATRYSTGSQMVPAQFNLGMARLDTDQGYAENALSEDLAGRGIFDSSWRPYLYGQQISTPFGRARQDLALGAAGQYADLGSQYGDSLLQGNQALFDAYQQRASDAFQAQPLGLPIGGYDVPPLPSFSPVYEPSRRARRGGGRTRSRRNRRNRRNR